MNNCQYHLGEVSWRCSTRLPFTQSTPEKEERSGARLRSVQDSSSVCLESERLKRINVYFCKHNQGRLLPDLCLECAHTVSLVPVSTA